MRLSAFTDYHLHTPLCRHATGEPDEYVRAAIELGLAEVGFADHSPMPEPFDDWRMLIDELPRYVESVLAAREKFAPFPVRLGLEVDFIAGHERWIEKLVARADWDFLIGSVHYIAPGWDVDNPRWIGRFEERPVEEIWALYFEAYEQCIRSGLFDFVAHPDLVKKFGHRPDGDLRRFYDPVIAALAATDIGFELNTAGLRKPAGEIYPSREFVALAHAAGVPMLVNSDAHAPAEVGAGFLEAETLLREVGVAEVVRFEKRQRKTVLVNA